MKPRFILITLLYLSVSLAAFGGQSLSSQQVKSQQPASCDNPQTPEQLLKCAESFGKISSYVVTTGAVANATLSEQSYDQSWIPDANVLVITYATPVTLWRVERSLCKLEGGTWLMQANPKQRGLTKQEIVQIYALPDCVSIPECLQKSNPPPPTCPQICEKLPADEIIKFIGEVKVKPGIPMTFGVAGPNIWGKGGAIQWQMLNGFTVKGSIETVIVW
jgi:hypothetical protein